MCTAISVTAGDNYFGRNLDYETSFEQKVTITPRRYKFTFTNGRVTGSHYAIIGMAVVRKGYPLYFDATNEKGLSIAGLRFAGNAVYNSKIDGKDNIASFEFIPYILSLCKNVKEAENLIRNINITDLPFNAEYEPSPLHWLIADTDKAITVEQTKKGLFAYDNPVCVLTNNPTFDMQMFNLNNYMSLSADEPKNTFFDGLDLINYSRGMGALGLPGDYSSQSRFVKTAFLRANSLFEGTEEEKVNQFFHILYSVYQLRGVVKVGNRHQITHYTSCCNADKGIYYYTTYGNCSINSVELYKENIDSDAVIEYELKKRR